MPVNLETIAGCGLSYDGKAGAPALQTVLEQILADPDAAQNYRDQAAAHAAEAYSWEAVTDQYERMCYELSKHELPERLWQVESKVKPPT